MTDQELFDAMAATALESILTREEISIDKPEAIAQRAYRLAVAMMAEREKYEEVKQ